jgi:hypothetical protein
MNMKEHILAALREQFERWDELLAALREVEILAPHFDLDWSIKDVIAHLWAWQQISIARLEGGVQDGGPKFPRWMTDLGENWEESADHVNAVTYGRNHAKPWTEIHQNWRNGFLRFLEVGSRISERDLLDGGRYPWLKGYSLAFILVASYEHHQEHFEKLAGWLSEHGG